MKQSKLIFIFLISVITLILVGFNFRHVTNAVTIVFSVRLDTPLAVDKHYLYTITTDNSIVKYDKYDNFRKVTSKKIIVHEVRNIAVDDKSLYLISWDGTLRVYDKTSLDEQAVLKGHSFWTMALYLTDDYVYTGSWDCSLKVWNKTNFQLLTTLFLNESDYGPSLDKCCQINAIVADNDRFYVACETPYLLVVDKIKNKITTKNIPPEGNRHPAIEFLDFDDKYLYSTSGDGFLKMWDKKDFHLIKQFLCSSKSAAYAVGSDENRIYCGGSETFFLDKNNFTYIQIKLPFEEVIHNIIFDEKNVYLGSMANKVFVIDKASNKLKTFFEIN